jgi:gas vesicle protein
LTPPGVQVAGTIGAQEAEYTADAAVMSKAEWMLKWAPFLGLGAAVGIAAALIFRRGKGKRKKKAKAKKPKAEPKVRHKKAKRTKGKKGRRRADIRYPASAGPEKRGKHKSAGSGALADVRKGGGVSDKELEVRRLRALYKGASKTAKGGSKMAPMARKAKIAIKEKLSKLHARVR